MKKLLIAVAILATGAVQAEEYKPPTELELLEREQKYNEAIYGIDQISSLLDQQMKTNYIQCMKAVGHKAFCKCTSKNIEVGLNFVQYVAIISYPADQDDVLEEDDKWKIQRAAEFRTKCVSEAGFM